MKPLLTRADFDDALATGCAIVVRDVAKGTRIHLPPCSGIKAVYFEQKVILGRGKNGSYTSYPTLADAIAVHGDVTCPWCCRSPRRVQSAGPGSRGAASGLSRAEGGEGADGARYLVAKGPNVVKAWSMERLNFLPKDWREDFRAELEAAVAGLRAREKERLHALLVSRSRELFDTENVLFFNIQTEGRPFAACASREVRFERGFGDPPRVSERPPFEYFHHYRVENVEAGAHLWAKRGALAKWEPQTSEDPRGWKRAAHVWRWIRKARVETAPAVLAVPDHFGIRVVLHGPVQELNLLGLVKPLLDGIVAALQADDGSSPQEGIAKHAGNAGLSLTAAAGELRDTTRAVLGRTRLIKRDGLMQPSDDRCVLGELVLSPERLEHWECSGEVFAVAEIRGASRVR